jgi:MFS family permease
MRARWAVTATFFINGLTLASYINRIPSLKAQHGFSDTQLGVVMTAFGLSALLSMQFVGGLVARFGSARLMRAGLLVMPFAIVAVGYAPGTASLVATLIVLGAVHGAVDVSMNAHAVAVERLLGRPVLNGCHAAWSISAVVAALVGAAVIRAGGPPGPHFVGVAVFALVAGLVATSGLLPPSADRPPGAPTAEQTAEQLDGPAADRPKASGRAGWTPAVVRFGAMGFGVMLCEAAVVSWSGVYLHDRRGATLAAAALGFAAYTVCQTVGRLVGDRLTARFGGAVVFRTGAAIAAAGAVALLARSAPVAIVGFGVIGLGESVLLPLVYSAVGRAGGDAGRGAATYVARLTTFTYAGILIGPAAIGGLAAAITLTWTFAGLFPLLVALALNARRLAPAPPVHDEKVLKSNW